MPILPIISLILVAIAGATLLAVLVVRARARRAVMPGKRKVLQPVGFGGWE